VLITGWAAGRNRSLAAISYIHEHFYILMLLQSYELSYVVYIPEEAMDVP
jgi:hypothetical protein